MQLGIFAKTFARPTLGEILDAVVRHGVTTVQFNFACAGLDTLPEVVTAAQLEAIRGELVRRQLHVAAVSGTFNLLHPDADARRAGFRRFPELLRACAALAVPVVTLCTGTKDPDDMWRAHPANGSPAAWREMRAGLENLLTAAEAAGITLAVEPEAGNVVGTARQARQLLDELRSPRLGIVLDAANLVTPALRSRQREVVDEAFDLLGPDIVLAHAKELGPEGHPDGRGAGRGILEWEHLRERLCQAGFAGAWILHGLPEEEVPASVDFLRDQLIKS